MKNSKKLKLILILLICILIILAGIIGVYAKKGNIYANLLPEYKLASDLKGSITLEIEVDDSTNTVYYDKEGNKVDSSIVTEDNESDYTKKEEAVNSEENLTKENYENVSKIMEERLKFLKADQYRIDLDENTGKIVLTVEDDYMSDIKSIVPMEARLELVDSNTEDIIMDYTDFKSAESTYASLDDGYVTYISLKLNDTGMEKINNIDKYKNTVDTEENEDENTEETANTCKVMFDDEEIAEVSYEDLLLNGKTLRITTASKITASSTVQSQINMNAVVAKLANIGKMPLIYKITAEEYVKASTEYNYVAYGIIGICIIISIIFIAKYKVNGVLSVISFITNISLLLIITRLTDVSISFNSIAAIMGLIVLNTILVNNILSSLKNKEKSFSDNIKNAYSKSIDAIIMILIILIVFSFNSMTVINAMGLLLFWGWLIVLLGNLAFTIPMLSIVNKE